MNTHCATLLVTLLFAIHAGALAGSVRELSCTTSEDCTLIQDAVCSTTGMCECAVGSVINSDMLKCLPAALGYGSACEESVQCSTRLLSAGTCLPDGTCGCAPEFHYLNGRCWKSVGLNGACSSSEECYENYNFESLSCSPDQLCVCSPGFYLHQSRTYCRRLGTAVGDDCFFDFDCQFGPDDMGVCNNNGQCQVKTFRLEDEGGPVNYELNDVETIEAEKVVQEHAVNLLVESCTADTECQNLDPNAVCGQLNFCWCAKGFFFKGSSCVRELGEACTQDTECQHIANTQCRMDEGATEGSCSCNALFAAEQNNQYCVRLRPDLTFNCQKLEEACQNFGPLSYCSNPRCECYENSHFVTEFMSCWKTRGVHESCTDIRDCLTDAGDMICDPVTQQCECKGPDFYETAEGVCRELSHEIGDPCVEDSDCGYDMPMCINQQCGCATGYFPFTDEANITSCVTGIGGNCSTTEECALVEDSLCDLNKSECVCDTQTSWLVASEARDKCLEVSEFGGPCVDVMQCDAAFGKNSTCFEDTCGCIQDYHYKNQGCWPVKKLTEKCTSSSQCYLPTASERTECRNGLCVCKYEFAQNGDDTDCTSGGTGVGRNLGALTAVIVLVTALVTSAW